MNEFNYLTQWSHILLEDDDFDAWVLESAMNDLADFKVIRFAKVSEIKEVIAALPENAIFWLDVDLQEVNGFEFYRSLPNQPLAVMVTAHPEYALEGFEIHAFDFLVKPLNNKRLKETLCRLEEYLRLKGSTFHDLAHFDSEHIEVKEGYVIHKLKIDDILYAEALRDFTKVVTTQKRIVASCNLKTFLGLTASGKLMRAHRSYAVNINRINAMNHETIWMHEVEIPIGKMFREELQRVWGLRKV